MTNSYTSSCKYPYDAPCMSLTIKSVVTWSIANIILRTTPAIMEIPALLIFLEILGDTEFLAMIGIRLLIHQKDVLNFGSESSLKFSPVSTPPRFWSPNQSGDIGHGRSNSSVITQSARSSTSEIGMGELLNTFGFL